MNSCIDIERAVEIVNKRSTTVDQLCKFIYKDIQAYQDSREDFYLREFEDQHNEKHLSKDIHDVADDCANFVLNKILKDTKSFSIKYSTESIDAVLDAMNQKRFKTVKGSESLLILLSTLKEMNEKED